MNNRQVNLETTESTYEEELQNLQKDVNFILDDILNIHYPGSNEELELHKDIVENYNVNSAHRLHDLISAKTPYKRVLDIFLQFHHLLFEFIAIVDKIKAMDRIFQRRNNLKDDLHTSFNKEYHVEIENCAEVAKDISKMAIFFEYFVPNNDRVLSKIFIHENLRKLYISVNNINHFWSTLSEEPSAEQFNDSVYLRTLTEIRKIDAHELNKIILSWKYLQKNLKFSYPSNRIWYSKKAYFSLFRELIEILEEYHKLNGQDNLDEFVTHEKKKKSKLRILKPRFNLRNRSFQKL